MKVPQLYIGEAVLKTLTVILLAAIVVFGWQTAADILESDRDDIAITVENISNRIALQFQIARLSQKPVNEALPMPVYGISLDNVNDTWGAAREEGRTHEGVDIFAERNTPVFSTTRGYVTELNIGDRGGKNVMVVGPGGLFYYYAHLSEIAEGITPGRCVTQDTVLGYVGNSGNASGTPPHLHFSIYPEMWDAINPYPKLVDRWSD